MLSQELGILFLDVSRIRKHHGTEITRRRCCPDSTAIPICDKEWQPPGMIYMGMRQHNCVYLIDRNWKSSVLPIGITSLPLEHPTVEQDGFSIYAQDMARARYFTSCTIELDVQKTSALGYCGTLEQNHYPLLIL